ncbi:MAG: hypothetical protein AAF253_13770 [Pseudomonadota bacterium]
MFNDPAIRTAFEIVPPHRWPILIWQLVLLGLWLQQVAADGGPLPRLWVHESGMIYQVPPPSYALMDSTSLSHIHPGPDFGARAQESRLQDLSFDPVMMSDGAVSEPPHARAEMGVLPRLRAALSLGGLKGLIPAAPLHPP